MSRHRGAPAEVLVDSLLAADYAGGAGVGTALLERPGPQLPDMGIERIEGVSEHMTMTPDEIPWLNSALEVSLRRIHLIGGTSIMYGSMVGGNRTLSQLAGEVCPDRSRQIQQALFTSLPNWLEGRPVADIHRVDAQALVGGLFKATRGKRDPARLYFVRSNSSENPATPVIMKAAVARHKDQPKVLAILTSLRRRGLGNMA